MFSSFKAAIARPAASKCKPITSHCESEIISSVMLIFKPYLRTLTSTEPMPSFVKFKVCSGYSWPSAISEARIAPKWMNSIERPSFKLMRRKNWPAKYCASAASVTTCWIAFGIKMFASADVNASITDTLFLASSMFILPENESV